MGAAAVLASAVNAGIMLSRSGSANAVPRPRSTVRRGIAFLEIIMIGFPYRLADSSPRAIPMLNGVLVTMPEMIADQR